MLSVLPEICVHLACELTGEHCQMIERVVEHLHNRPCPNNKCQDMAWPTLLISSGRNLSSGKIWLVPMLFTKDNFPLLMHLTGSQISGMKEILYQYMKGLGFVECGVTSKILWIRSIEQAWSNLKQIKDGKRSNISCNSLEKRAILLK